MNKDQTTTDNSIDDNFEIAIWPGTILEEEQHEDFVEFFKDQFDVRVKVLESVTTIPSKDDKGNDIPKTGGRIDVFFKVHKDDVNAFFPTRFMLGTVTTSAIKDAGLPLYYTEEVVAKYF